MSRQTAPAMGPGSQGKRTTQYPAIEIAAGEPSARVPFGRIHLRGRNTLSIVRTGPSAAISIAGTVMQLLRPAIGAILLMIELPFAGTACTMEH
jgi:hypothetical protein